MFERNAASYEIRHHRLNSVSLHLTNAELTEIRAAQRTFEGAYARTSLGLFSFSLIVLKIFTFEFYPIGVLFAVFGALMLIISWYRRAEGNRQFYITPEEGGKQMFRTSGNVVLLMTVLTASAYATVLVLVLRLQSGVSKTTVAGAGIGVT